MPSARPPPSPGTRLTGVPHRRRSAGWSDAVLGQNLRCRLLRHRRPRVDRAVAGGPRQGQVQLSWRARARYSCSGGRSHVCRKHSMPLPVSSPKSLTKCECCGEPGRARRGCSCVFGRSHHCLRGPPIPATSKTPISPPPSGQTSRPSAAPKIKPSSAKTTNFHDLTSEEAESEPGPETNKYNECWRRIVGTMMVRIGRRERLQLAILVMGAARNPTAVRTSPAMQD